MVRPHIHTTSSALTPGPVAASLERLTSTLAKACLPAEIGRFPEVASMVMQLMVVAGADKGLALALSDEGPVRLGRSQSILTRLTDPHVSRVHCELQVAEGQVVVTDSNSAGGTFVNGKRVS